MVRHRKSASDLIEIQLIRKKEIVERVSPICSLQASRFVATAYFGRPWSNLINFLTQHVFRDIAEEPKHATKWDIFVSIYFSTLNFSINSTSMKKEFLSSHSHFFRSHIALSQQLRVAIVFCRFSRSASSTGLKLSIAFLYSVSVCGRLFDGGRSPIFCLSKARSLLVKAKSKLLMQFRPYENLARDIFFSLQHGLLHRSGHSALKPVPFVKPIFRDFATTLVRSGLPLWACAV